MEYEERISTEQGNYIVASGKDFEDILIKEPIRLITGNINPGEETTLHGWFTRPVRFCGFLSDPEVSKLERAIFYLGGGSGTLFTPAGEYYDLTYVFGSDHIGKAYNERTFHDCYLREKNNKHFWK